MRDFFSMDGKLYTIVETIVDCMIVSILWCVFSLPIFTVGASTAALYYTVHKVIRNGDGKLWNTFWSTFKSNFGQATALWGILFAVLAVVGLNCYLAYSWQQVYPVFKWLVWILLILLAFCVTWSSYCFAYITHIQDKTKTVLKNTFIMCLMHIRQSILILLVSLLATACVVILPFSIFFFVLLPGLSMYLVCPFLRKVFSHYWDIPT